MWGGATFLSKHIEKHPELVRGQTVLELGAGAGLPSLISGALGAKKVVVTDYPDADLIENLQYNIDHCELLAKASSPAKSDVIIAEASSDPLWLCARSDAC